MSESLENLVPDIQSPTYKIGERTFALEPFCAYKVAHVLKAVSKFSDDVQLRDLVEALVATQGSVDLVGALTTLLPRLMQTAPDAIVGMLALAVIPNAELETLSDTPGAIANRVNAEVKFFNFRASGAEVAELAALCIPLIGLDALKKAVPALGQRVMESLGLQLQEPSENSPASTPSS